REVLALPDAGSPSVLSALHLLGDWFDSLIISTVENYMSPEGGDGSRSVEVDRAKHLSRRAEEESAVSELVQEMASERDTRRLLELVARSAAHLAGAKKAAVIVPRGESLAYGAAYRMPLSYLNSFVRRTGTPLSGALEPDEPASIVTGLADDRGSPAARAARKLEVSTAMRVPMRVGDRDVGLLELFDPLTEHAWTERNVDLAQELAAQAALAFENAQLLAQTGQRAHELTDLNHIGQELASQLTSPQLLSLAASGAARLLRAQSALVWLRVPGTRRFELAATHGEEFEGATAFELGKKGALADAVKGGVAVMSPDARRELSWARGWAMSVPLRVGARMSGVLVVHRKQAPFDDNDVRVTEALAGQIVAALQNARLYEESRFLSQRLNAAIAALGEALAAALDMQELLQVVAEKAAELADAAGAIIFLDDDSGRLAVRALATRGDEDRPAAEPRAYEGIAALAIERNEPVSRSARDQRTDERTRRAMREERIRIAYGFPLTVRGRPAGALCVLGRGELRPQERELMASFSRQASVGVENVVLFGETQQRLAELAELARASARVSSTLEQDAIGEIIAESVSRALRLPVAATVLLDADGAFYLPEGGHRGLPADFVTRFAARPDSIAFSVVADQRMKVVSDIAAEKRDNDSLVEGLGLGSLICAPLKGKEGVLGIIFAADHAPRTFRSHEEALMSAYANEAALALQNALHHQAVTVHAREVEGIVDATRTLSSTDELQPVLDHLASTAASLLGAPVCSIMILDERNERLNTVASCGLPGDHGLHADLQADESIRGMVALRGVSMTSTDLPRDGRFKYRDAARAEGLRSMLAVPLIAKGKAIGAIAAFNRSAQPFTSAQERLLGAMAAEASVAIENARLYTEGREQARSMRLLMEEVNHRVKNNLQSIIGIIQLDMSRVEDPRVIEALRELVGRVQAIAVVQELLFDEDLRAVDVKETSRRILENALRSNDNLDLKILGQVTGARVRLPSRKATPLASVVNELVYNSVSHAFGGRDQGSVSISLQEVTGGQILVQVSDDGVGLPSGFSLERDAKLGLRIVEGLVTQDLGGEFAIASSQGTIARVTFAR
ncbi:MAG: GAF domain-containing protein, partial [Armatimonadota bacterium]